MSESAIDRVTRVLDLVPYILENPGIEISVLADHFNVTAKQAMADLELIFLCGLPGYTPYELIDLSFEDGVVTIIDPQVLDKPRVFNEIEAVVLTLGLSVMKGAIDESEKVIAISELQAKIAAKFTAISDISYITKSKPKFYDLVSQAVSKELAINVTYRSLSRDEVSERLLFPKRVYLAQGNFYFTAIDSLSNQERHFRMDLIEECKASDSIHTESEATLDREEIFQFKVRTQNKYLIERYNDLFTDVSQEGDFYEAQGWIGNLQWLKRMIISNSPDIDLLEPAFLREELAGQVQSILRLYA